MNRFSRFLSLTALSLLGSSGQAAVHLSENNTGQAIIVPFYSTARENGTLMTISNTTDQPKAVKLLLNEGRDGTTLISANVYLDAHDVFKFGLFETTNSTAQIPELLTIDTNCVLLEYTVDLSDPAVVLPGHPDWQTGSLEIIEMGELQTEGSSPFVLQQLNNQCELINEAWETDGMWTNDPAQFMNPASGGLQVEASVINVFNGFAFSVPVTTLGGFFDPESMAHTAPDELTPNLSSGTHDSLLIHQGEVLATTWPTGYEAVSALLATTRLENDFDIDPLLLAHTEWVISFPTLNYHRNNPDSQLPFYLESEGRFRFPAFPSSAFVFHDRDQQIYQAWYGCVIPPPGTFCPPVGLLTTPLNSLVISLDEHNHHSQLFSDAEQTHVLTPAHAFAVPDDFYQGKVVLDINSNADDRWTPAYAIPNDRGTDSQSGATQLYAGLPVTGFAFTRYLNAQAQPGLLANYAVSKPHRSQRQINPLNP
jgi:hypothetical protein